MTGRNRRPLAVYIRQSRRKERTISLDEQRRAIRAWAEAEGAILGHEVVEQGVSGSKHWRERGLGEVVGACERGELSGVVVAYQDRLSRENGLATAEVWDALDRAGARLVCAAEGLDTAHGDHEMLFSIKAAIAREQWKRSRDNWAGARRKAVERGAYPTKPPAGYSKDEDGRLTPNEHAAAMTEALVMAAKGRPWREVAAHLTAEGVPTSGGRGKAQGESTSWSPRATRKAMTNEAYSGTVRVRVNGSEAVCRDAHPPLCDRATRAAILARRGERPAIRGDGQGYLLTGLAYCTCGRRMQVDTPRGRNQRQYVCRNHECDARAAIGADRLEEHVQRQFLDRVGFDVLAMGYQGDGAPDAGATEDELRAAEDKLAAFLLHADPRDAGYADALAAFREEVSQAEATLGETGARPADPLEGLSLRDPGLTPEETEARWRALDVPTRREVLSWNLDRLGVRKALHRGRTPEPVGDRAEIAWR